MVFPSDKGRSGHCSPPKITARAKHQLTRRTSSDLVSGVGHSIFDGEVSIGDIEDTNSLEGHVEGLRAFDGGCIVLDDGGVGMRAISRVVGDARVSAVQRAEGRWIRMKFEQSAQHREQNGNGID